MDPSVGERRATVLAALRARMRPDGWPQIEGFTLVGRARPMRVVLRGLLPGPDGAIEVAVKWQRPDRATDRARAVLRGARGPREEVVLQRLGAAGVAAPTPLASSADPDLLVTGWRSDLAPLPRVDRASADLVRRVARALGRAHRAGLVAHDLHAANLAIGADGEVVVVDAGGARIGAPDLVASLARHAHALLEGARRPQRHRALVAFLGELDPHSARRRARRLARRIQRAPRAGARAYREGRDRRATRDGRHFATFAATCAERSARGIRFLDATDASIEGWLAARLSEGDSGDPLKAGGAVRRTTLPDGRTVVVKRYRAVAPGRLPRAMRAFRLAHAFRNRHLEAPLALAAIAAPRGPSVAAFEFVAGADLHAALEADGPFDALDRDAQRTALARLGRALRRLHDADIRHRDLKCPNLVWQHDQGTDRFTVVDLDGAALRVRGVPWSMRARDLGRLAASNPLGPVAAARVLRAYWAAGSAPAGLTRRVFARRVAAFVRAKRGPDGLPR